MVRAKITPSTRHFRVILLSVAAPQCEVEQQSQNLRNAVGEWLAVAVILTVL
jgi:hypothetical protein